ncbi:MAG: ABC transporter ATP-binding protein [Firmicutes bacterium]|nr:ABC transporter ATP-binding protein [Bacillota bacterium]
MSSLLEVADLHVNIGGYQILQGVSLAVPEHAVTVLLGRNGAGKTTTMRSIMGYVRSAAGEIRWRGERLQGLRPYQVARRGIGYMPEEGHLFANLTVQDNLAMVARKSASYESRLERALTLFPDLRIAWSRRAGTLSGGQKQMLGLARLLVAAPALMLIDEPSKGLSPGMVEVLAGALSVLREATTILLVEQNFRLASRVGDHFSVIDEGRTCLSGSMEQLVARVDWQQQYLGLTATREEV